MAARRAHEVSSNDLSNSGAEPMQRYMSVDYFIFCDKSLVGRFTHMNLTLQDLQQWSGPQWRHDLESNWMFKILGEGFFKIEFFYKDDCEFVLNNGPWFMGVAGLSLKRWSPGFDLQNPGTLKTPIWVRLMNLPVQLLRLPVELRKEEISNICSVLGKVLKRPETNVYKVCVEVDLSERLYSEINVYEGNNYIGQLKLVYEGLRFLV